MTYKREKTAIAGFQDRWSGSLTRKTIIHLVLLLLSITPCLFPASSAIAVEPPCPGGSHPDPNVIWCDDFDDGISPARKYWSYNNGGGAGSFKPVNGVGLDGSAGMQVDWQTGQVEAGNIKMLFGRNPLAPGIQPGVDFKEIYWRLYVKMKEGWTGNPQKLSRATIMANQNWAQAMIAHLWEGSLGGGTLGIDPASGIDANGSLATTVYNDFPNLRWLGHQSGVTPIFSSAPSGQWHCVEAHVKLNTPGSSDGVFEFWVDGNREAGSNNLDWVGTWQQYGINGIFIENYWNSGAPGPRTRYMDNFVVSKTRIGCNPADPGVPDSIPPTVTPTNPTGDQVAVPVNTTVSAAFSEAVDPQAVNTTTFLVRQGSTGVPGTVLLKGTTATFTPSAPLAGNTRYTATITGGVKDIAGNATLADTSWSFTTGVASGNVAPDTAPPAVSSTTPANGTAGVSISAPVAVMFNEPIDSSSIGPSSFKLTAGGAPVPCTINASGAQATITPAENLAYNTEYTATVTTSVKDAAGNTLPNSYAWTFTTQPSRQSPSPSNNVTGGGGGCSVATEGKSGADSTFGMLLGVFIPGISWLLRKAVRRRRYGPRAAM